MTLRPLPSSVTHRLPLPRRMVAPQVRHVGASGQVKISFTLHTLPSPLFSHPAGQLHGRSGLLDFLESLLRRTSHTWVRTQGGYVLAVEDERKGTILWTGHLSRRRHRLTYCPSSRLPHHLAGKPRFQNMISCQQCLSVRNCFQKFPLDFITQLCLSRLVISGVARVTHRTSRVTDRRFGSRFESQKRLSQSVISPFLLAWCRSWASRGRASRSRHGRRSCSEMR